jgi:hypothetical protein
MGIAGPVAPQRAGSHWIARAMAGVPRESMAADAAKAATRLIGAVPASVHRPPDFLSSDPCSSVRAAWAARISPQVRGESVCPQGVMDRLV